MSLTDKQLQAAFLLASGMQAKWVAEQLGVTPATICNWKGLAAFEAQKNAIMREVFNQQFESLLRLTAVSLEKLKSLMENGSENTQLQAVKLILSAAGFFGGVSEPHERIGLTIGPTTEDKVLQRRAEQAAWG